MVTASIIINQVGKPPGTAGISRDDLALGSLVTLSNSDNTGVLAWNWRLLAKPSGSTVSLATPTSSTSTFTPDVAGSYLIRLILNGRTTSTIIAAVKTSTLGMRVPASGETTEFGGWELAIQTILGQIEAALASGGPVPNHHTRHENGGIDEISVSGLSGLLADGQTPLGHNTSHKNGGSDEVATATPGANAIPKAGAGGKLDSWISNAAAGTSGLIRLNTDLGGTYSAPQVVGLLGYTLPALSASKFLRVNAGANGWELVTVAGGATAFTDLGDVPSSYTGEGGKYVAVNGGETALEFVSLPAGVVDFTDLGDVPSSYTGFDGCLVVVNAGGTALEFVSLPAGVVDFTDLGDVPSSYTGEGGKYVAVNGGETALEFVAAPAGGGGSGSFFQSDDEYSEAGTTFVTIGTFRLYIPTEITISNFLIVCSGWRDTGGTCQVQVAIGVDSYIFTFSTGAEVFDTHTMANSNAGGAVYDGYMKIRATVGATNAYTKYIEIYGV